jgi:hypothetical protein
LFGQVVFLYGNEQVQTDGFDFEVGFKMRLILTFGNRRIDATNVEFYAFFDVLTFEFDKNHFAAFEFSVDTEEEKLRLATILFSLKRLINEILKLHSLLF